MTKYTYITENIYNIWKFFTFIYFLTIKMTTYICTTYNGICFTFLIFLTLLQNQNKFTPLPNISIFLKKRFCN